MLMKSGKKSRAADGVIKEGTTTLANVRANWKRFQQDMAKRKVKAIPRDFCEKFEAAIADASAVAESQDGAKLRVREASETERELRRDLHEALVEIRDEIAETYEDDAMIRKAFLRGTRLKADVTTVLVAAAGQLRASFESKKWGAKARDAGITPARVERVSDLARKLRSADFEQGTSLAAQRMGTKGKASALREVEKLTARARKVARRIFKLEPDVLEAFGIGPKKRSNGKGRGLVKAPAVYAGSTSPTT